MTTLDGIDDVDWASLDHAYGSADDVPRVVPFVARPAADPATPSRSTA